MTHRRAGRPLPTLERVGELLRYDPATGCFKWLVDCGGRKRAGKDAGTLDGYGYLLISIDSRLVRAHRLAWFVTSGEWPKEQIDHINGVRLDNRIANLRDVSPGRNSANRHKVYARSGLMGAHADPGNKGFNSKITRDGVERSLGRFRTAEEAHSAYMAARAESEAR